MKRKEIIQKEELEKIINVKGEIIGAAMQEFAEFIQKDKGKEGVEAVEKIMVQFNFPKFQEIKRNKLYPLGFYLLLLLSLERLFNYDKKKFQEIGRLNAKFSQVIRFFMRYFISVDRAAKEVPRMWEKYYTIGNLRVSEHDEKKRYARLRIENFKLHPFHCQVAQGYFSAILGMIVKNYVNSKETKCVHWGDEYHEFLLEW